MPPDAPAMDAPDLSAVVLCYRAEESILKVVEPLYELLEREDVDFELVLVANYWPDRADRTPEVVKEFAAGHPRARVLAEPKAGGMGWDMRRGMAAARGGVMVIIDGDFQNPVEDVERMYREMKQTGAELMKGRRVARFDGPYRRVTSYVYNALFAVIFPIPGVRDINGKPKGLTRSGYERIELTSDDWFADAEIVLEAHRVGLRIAEMPVVFRRNDERASFVGVGAIFEFIVNMARARWRRRGR